MWYTPGNGIYHIFALDELIRTVIILIDTIDGLEGISNAQGLTIARLVLSTFPKNLKSTAWGRNDASTDPLSIARCDEMERR